MVFLAQLTTKTLKALFIVTDFGCNIYMVTKKTFLKIASIFCSKYIQYF